MQFIDYQSGANLYPHLNASSPRPRLNPQSLQSGYQVKDAFRPIWQSDPTVCIHPY